MGHGREITLGPLNIEDLSIALFGVEKVVHQGAGIAEVPERSRQCLLVGGKSIISYRRFPGSASLNEISAMEKNPGSMFIVIRHVRTLEGVGEVCYRGEPSNGASELQAMWKGVYLSLL
jgi:hypothetical protein